MSELLIFTIPEKPVNTDIRQNFIERIEKFQQAELKVGIQKKGELTDITIELMSKLFDLDVSRILQNNERELFGTVNDIGIALLRNKSICQLVAQDYLDIGLVGIDQVIESGFQDQLEVVLDFKEMAEWDLVIATPQNSEIANIKDIAAIATQYPVITSWFFALLNQKPTIISIQGSTELTPWLKSPEQSIDAIIDICVSGRTLAANGLIAWTPPVAKLYTVLVANKKALQKEKNHKLIKKLQAIGANI